MNTQKIAKLNLHFSICTHSFRDILNAHGGMIDAVVHYDQFYNRINVSCDIIDLLYMIVKEKDMLDHLSYATALIGYVEIPEITSHDLIKDKMQNEHIVLEGNEICFSYLLREKSQEETPAVPDNDVPF